MHFDEGRLLKQPQYREPESRKPVNAAAQQPNRCRSAENSRPPLNLHAQVAPEDWKAATVLDSANNKLQELMQLLYLLSRDPSIPNDARYHVTVAQSEIALLARQMQNTAEAQACKTDLG